MRALLVVLLAASFVLPTLGFGRLLWRSQQVLDGARAKVAERGHDRQTLVEFDERYEGSILEAPLDARRDLVWDIVLVGLGMAAGAAAGILPLFIAVGAPS